MDENTSSQPANNYVELTSGIVASFVASNSVQRESIPDLIASVHAALSSLDQPAPERPKPLISVKKSITRDYIISMEDGRHYKTLKRHLTGRGLTPAEYREKWGLPGDYPMTAPGYAARRSELAKSLGLGRKREPQRVGAEAPKKRGRKPAAQTEASAPPMRGREKAA